MTVDAETHLNVVRRVLRRCPTNNQRDVVSMRSRRLLLDRGVVAAKIVQIPGSSGPGIQAACKRKE